MLNDIAPLKSSTALTGDAAPTFWEALRTWKRQGIAIVDIGPASCCDFSMLRFPDHHLPKPWFRFTGHWESLAAGA